MAQITLSIVDHQTENFLLKQRISFIEESLLVQSILLQNILEENTCLKKLNSQARISPNSNTIKDIINRKKENEFLFYNYFICSDIFDQISSSLNNYISPFHHIMENAPDKIIIHIIKHLNDKEYMIRSPLAISVYWSVTNFACYYSKLSILKYLIKNEIGIWNPDAWNLEMYYIFTASEFSNEKIIAYLFNDISKHIDPQVSKKKSILCKYIDNNPNLNTINKIAFKKKINDWN